MCTPGQERTHALLCVQSGADFESVWSRLCNITEVTRERVCAKGPDAKNRRAVGLVKVLRRKACFPGGESDCAHCQLQSLASGIDGSFVTTSGPQRTTRSPLPINSHSAAAKGCRMTTSCGIPATTGGFRRTSSCRRRTTSSRPRTTGCTQHPTSCLWRPTSFLARGTSSLSRTTGCCGWGTGSGQWATSCRRPTTSCPGSAVSCQCDATS